MHKWDILYPKKGEEMEGKILRETDDAIEFQDRESRQKQTIARSDIDDVQRAGRPILVGTVSIERSEMIAKMLDQRGVPHQVLNAKHHQREAEIIAQAGRKNAVTIATNMAGRGTDIILGGNPEAMAWALLQMKYPTKLDVPPEEMDALIHEIEQREQMKPEGREVAEMGGLHVLGSERHDARRIDLQLRGRCGRQGDPGSSRFYLSLEDDLMRKFGGEWVKNWLTRLGMQDGEAIESKMVSRRIEGRPEEGRRAELRDSQKPAGIRRGHGRAAKAGLRLSPADSRRGRLQAARARNDPPADRRPDRPVPRPRLRHGDIRQMGGQGVLVEFDARNFRGLDFQDARRYAADEAERKAEYQIMDALEENLPTDSEDKDEWNWEALAKFANTRWHLAMRDRDLKQIGRGQLDTFLLEKARAAIAKTDLSPGREFLEADYGLRAACAG